MKKLINLFKKLLGYKITPEPYFALVPEEHVIKLEEVACEMQTQLDIVEINNEVSIEESSVDTDNTCVEKENVCPEVNSEQCACEEGKVEEPVKKKRRGRPRKRSVKKD